MRLITKKHEERLIEIRRDESVLEYRHEFVKTKKVQSFTAVERQCRGEIALLQVPHKDNLQALSR